MWKLLAGSILVNQENLSSQSDDSLEKWTVSFLLVVWQLAGTYAARNL